MSWALVGALDSLRRSCSEITWLRAPCAGKQHCSEDSSWVRSAGIRHDEEGDRRKTGKVPEASGWFQKLRGLGAQAREFEEKVEKRGRFLSRGKAYRLDM